MTIAEIDGQYVSRETLQILECYVELIRKWSPKINLAAKSTLDNIWARHIRDSLQIVRLMQSPNGHWVDLGSGGGFPGLVVALTKHEIAPGLAKVTLVESDQRKAAFLRTVLRETGKSAAIVPKRIEQIEPLGADILSARALAPLPRLLNFAERHLNHTGTALFPKGINWAPELEEAQRTFSFRCIPHNSETQQGAAILQIEEISRV